MFQIFFLRISETTTFFAFGKSKITRNNTHCKILFYKNLTESTLRNLWKFSKFSV